MASGKNYDKQHTINSIKVGQYVYKNEQESKRNVYYNTPTSEQVEKIKKLTEKLKKKEKLNNE